MPSPSDADSKPSPSDAERKPSISPSPVPSSPPRSKKRRTKSTSQDKKPKVKAGHAPGRPWTGSEYAALFKLVNEVGKAEAFANFPGRTRNQAYQAWR